MDLSRYIVELREELAVAAAAGGEDARALADRLTAPLESAVRLALLDALSGAAAEITRELAPGSVEVRLRGKDPEFVVTTPQVEHSDAEDPSPVESPWRSSAAGDDATLTRINLRLPQDLKDRVDEAARAAGLSVNAWLVRSAAAAVVGAGTGSRSQPRPTARGGDRYTGWTR